MKEEEDGLQEAYSSLMDSVLDMQVEEVSHDQRVAKVKAFLWVGGVEQVYSPLGDGSTSTRWYKSPTDMSTPKVAVPRVEHVCSPPGDGDNEYLLKQVPQRICQHRSRTAQDGMGR